MKFGKIDIVFLIVYIIILIILLMTQYWLDPKVGIPEQHVEGYRILWDMVAYILLYAIVVPIIYFGLRRYLQNNLFRC